MNTLDFRIEPSQSSNDHQVRIIVDGADWLGDDSLGIDPPEFFAQDALRLGGKVLIGRCDCGCVGCCDVNVTMSRQENSVDWTLRSGGILQFSPCDYDRLIETSLTDFSWEDERRTAERLVSELFRGSKLEDGSIYDWASARIGRGIITLSFSNKGAIGAEQKTFEFGWDGKNPESALPAAKRFKKERVEP